MAINIEELLKALDHYKIWESSTGFDFLSKVTEETFIMSKEAFTVEQRDKIRAVSLT